VTPKGQTRDPNTLRAQYLENNWRCYLATIKGKVDSSRQFACFAYI